MIIVAVNPFPFLIHLYFYPPVLGSNFDTITAISKDDINPIVLAIPGLTSDSESPVSFICIYFHSLGLRMLSGVILASLAIESSVYRFPSILLDWKAVVGYVLYIPVCMHLMWFSGLLICFSLLCTFIISFCMINKSCFS